MASSVPSLETILGWIKGAIPILKRAWMTLNGPAIGIKLLACDATEWQVEVTNVRGGVAVPRVFLEDVTDDKDRTTRIVTSPVEVYRLESLLPIRLFGNARAVFGILSVDNNAAGPLLRI